MSSAPTLADRVERYAQASGRFLVCLICTQARDVGRSGFVGNAEAAAPYPCAGGSATILR